MQLIQLKMLKGALPLGALHRHEGIQSIGAFLPIYCLTRKLSLLCAYDQLNNLQLHNFRHYNILFVFPLDNGFY